MAKKTDIQKQTEEKKDEKKPVKKGIENKKTNIIPQKNIQRESKKISGKQRALFDKKITLAKKGRHTKWAPVWAVIKKFGVGKKVHPSAITKHRRSWRRTKLHITPRRQQKSHFG